MNAPNAQRTVGCKVILQEVRGEYFTFTLSDLVFPYLFNLFNYIRAAGSEFSTVDKEKMYVVASSKSADLYAL
jgi:predicted acyltransferase